MANDVISELGFADGVTNSAFKKSLAQEDDEKKEDAGEEKKEKGDEKKEGGNEKKEGGDEKKEGADEKKEGGDDKKDGDAKAPDSGGMKSTKKPPKPAKTATKDEVKDYEKGTPAYILDNPDYLDQVNRYMPEFYQDPAL
jgi:hypothetical protein